MCSTFNQAPQPTGPPGHQPNGHRPNTRVASPPLVMMMMTMMVMMVVMMMMMMIMMMMVYTSEPAQKTVKDTMSTNVKYVDETAKKNNSTGFGRFKAKLADILTEENSLQLATFFHYPPAKIDLLKQNKDSRNHLMIRYMEERGEITETDITTLLRALKVLNLHVIKKRVQSLFELHTGKLCTGDDQSMQQPEDTMSTNVKYVEETAKKNNSTGFGSFKAELVDILTEDIILQLAIYFNYPPVKYDLLKKDVGRNHLMIRLLEERGEITETDITTLLRALKVLNLHVIQKRVQTLFELHTGKLCTGDDQSMQQPEALNFGKLDLGPKGYMTADGTSLRLESFRSADKDNINLANGKSMPVMPALEELQIKTNKGTEFNQDQVVGLLSYARHCQRLKKLSFIDCVLPLSILVGSLPPISKLRNIQVSWTPVEHGITFHLDSSRGKWVSNSKEAMTLETNGQNSLRLLCSSIVFLRRNDSKQLQMSTILLLEIASSHNIPISHLLLKWSFSGFDGKDIRLASGLSLSSLSSVEKISINAGKQEQEFTEEEVIVLINHCIKSPRFKELWLDNCKLPSSINPDIIPEESRSRNIKVISSDKACYLDLIDGYWTKHDDIQTITGLCSDVLVIHRDNSESVQRSVIELLVEASNHDIPVYFLEIVQSFCKIDEDGNIILSSGLSLPILTSIEMIYIQTKKGRAMNKHEVKGILNYAQHSQRLTELQLADCLLPSSTPVGPSLSTLKSREVDVFWTPDSRKHHEYYRLDLDSGRWEKVGSW